MASEIGTATEIGQVASTHGSTLRRVARAEDVAAEGVYAASAGGDDIVLIRTGTGLHAFGGRCPHQGALLGEGQLDGDTLVCRNHQWRFNAATGAREGGPESLVACPVVQRGGEISVDVSPLVAGLHVGSDSAARTLADLPGPRGIPILGNAHQIDPSKLHRITERWAAEYGSMYVFRLGPRRILAVSDPRLSVQILRARPQTYRRERSMEAAFESLGISGVFSAEGPAWQPQRRFTMEALSPRRLPGFYPTLRAVVARLRRRFETAADRDEIVDVVEELKRFTVDVTTALAFGHDFNTIEQSGDNVIGRRLELVFPTLTKRVLGIVPLWRFIRLPSDRRVDRALIELRTWLDSVVAEARARLEAEPGRPASNFLEGMLVGRDESGEPYSDELIFGNLMNILLAGEDTASNTLAWAVHELCESTASVASLREESDHVLGSTTFPEDIATADRLVYAAAVANETMRLRPVAPVLFMETIVDSVLDDVRIPAKTPVLIVARPPVHDPARFGEPDDFRPDRWLGDSHIGPHDTAAYFPFGSGPRVCPGRGLALLEMKVVLATLYGGFDVTRVGTASDVEESWGFTMFPRHLKVRLRRRSPAGATIH